MAQADKQLAEGSLITHIDNIIHLVESADLELPACPDFDAMASLLSSTRNALDLLSLSAAPLQHCGLSHQDERLSKSIAALLATLAQLPADLQCLADCVNASAPLTKHLSDLKLRYSQRSVALLSEWQALRERDGTEPAHKLEQSQARHQRSKAAYHRAIAEPRLQRELRMQKECDELQLSIGAMLHPFVLAALLLKGSGKGKRGGVIIEGLDLSSEEASLVNRSMTLLLRHLSPPKEGTSAQVDGSSECPPVPRDLLFELEAHLEDFLHCLHLLADAMTSHTAPSLSNRRVATGCAAFQHTALRAALKTWATTQAALRELQSSEGFGSCVELFRSAQRELAAAHSDREHHVQEYRDALASYHRTLHEFKLLRFDAAQCCVDEFGVPVELHL